MKLIDGETLFYAEMVDKVNQRESKQKRMLVITDKGVYNLHRKKIKRKIELREVGGISKTVPPSRCITEFTIHVPSSYDYRFSSTKREEILKALKVCYAQLM